jgi:hypothetical protein
MIILKRSNKEKYFYGSKRKIVSFAFFPTIMSDVVTSECIIPGDIIWLEKYFNIQEYKEREWITFRFFDCWKSIEKQKYSDALIDKFSK